MKGLKIILLVLFVFFLGLFRVVGFEIKKISLIQLQYNFIQTFIFFIILICLFQFDRLINKKRLNKTKTILFNSFFVIGVITVINFVNSELILFFNSHVFFWPKHVSLIAPVAYLIYGIFKALDKE
jgi:hypothetical protein